MKSRFERVGGFFISSSFVVAGGGFTPLAVDAPLRFAAPPRRTRGPPSPADAGVSVRLIGTAKLRAKAVRPLNKNEMKNRLFASLARSSILNKTLKNS